MSSIQSYASKKKISLGKERNDIVMQPCQNDSKLLESSGIKVEHESYPVSACNRQAFKPPHC